MKDLQTSIALLFLFLSTAAMAPELKSPDLAVLPNFGNSSECFPVFVRHEAGVDILTDYCSQEAFNKQGEEKEISEHFSVPEELARRFNFWRRVYSLWSHDQYVVHSSEYPEVILEILDVSRNNVVNSFRRDEIAKKLFKQRSVYYKSLLMKMHHMGAVATYTPEMQRLAFSMQHITDKKKFMIAAHSIRRQRGQYEEIAAGLARANKYLDAVGKAFEAQGIPSEISRIAFVESSFNIKARSKVDALGAYQIMPATGKQFLTIIPGIDERIDPIKAANAAAKILKQNYKMTQSWPLAITAYNHGPFGVMRAIRKTGTNDIARIINEFEGSGFGFASKNFYTSFLGMLSSVEDRSRVFYGVRLASPIRYSEFKLDKATKVSSVLTRFATTQEIFHTYNPDVSKNFIRANGVLPRGFVIKIPDLELAVNEKKPDQGNAE